MKVFGFVTLPRTLGRIAGSSPTNVGGLRDDPQERVRGRRLITLVTFILLLTSRFWRESKRQIFRDLSVLNFNV